MRQPLCACSLSRSLVEGLPASGSLTPGPRNSLLKELNLPASLQVSQQPLGVPAAVLDAAARVQAEGGVERLETMMKDVRRVADVNMRMLQEVRALPLFQRDVLGPDELSLPTGDRLTRPRGSK